MNEQKSFLAILGLVVAAGLVLGMVVFNMGGRDAAPADNAVAPVGNTIAAKGSGSQPSPESVASSDEPVGTIPPPNEQGTGPANEPAATSVDAPPLQAAGNGDPPPTVSSDQPASSDAPPSTPQ